MLLVVSVTVTVTCCVPLSSYACTPQTANWPLAVRVTRASSWAPSGAPGHLGRILPGQAVQIGVGERGQLHQGRSDLLRCGIRTGRHLRRVAYEVRLPWQSTPLRPRVQTRQHRRLERSRPRCTPSPCCRRRRRRAGRLWPCTPAAPGICAPRGWRNCVRPSGPPRRIRPGCHRPTPRPPCSRSSWSRPGRTPGGTRCRR